MPSHSSARTTGCRDAVRHPFRRSNATDLTDSLCDDSSEDIVVLPGIRATAMQSVTNINETASTTSAQTAPAATISSPAAALPTRDATCLAVENIPWADAINSLPTMDGMTEARAGFRNAVRLLSLNTATNATTGGRCPTAITTTATDSTTTAAVAFVATMIPLRSQRSASTPASGAKMASGICHTACTTAVRSVDWVSDHTTHITARLKKASPNTDAVCPPHSSAKDRLPKRRRWSPPMPARFNNDILQAW